MTFYSCGGALETHRLSEEERLTVYRRAYGIDVPREQYVQDFHIFCDRLGISLEDITNVDASVERTENTVGLQIRFLRS